MTNDNPHSPRWLTCDLDCDLCTEMQNCPLINPDEMTTRIMTSKHRGFIHKRDEVRTYPSAQPLSFVIDLRSSLLTLGIVQASLTLLSLNRRLHHSSFFILHSSFFNSYRLRLRFPLPPAFGRCVASPCVLRASWGSSGP